MFAGYGVLDSTISDDVPDSKPILDNWTKAKYCNNRGRRLDHIWASKDLDTILKSFLSCKEIRDWEKPSDHVPLILELSI